MASRGLHDFGVFSVLVRDVQSLDGKKSYYSTLSCPDWVNVIAFTDDKEIVLVRQFRHATNEFSVEFPGGIIDQKKSSLCEAKNELLEEAGFVSKNWHFLGSFRPNAALQDNWCHTFVCHSATQDKDKADVDCELILADEISFKEKWRPLLIKQALMAAPMMLALGSIEDSYLQQLFHSFFSLSIK